MSKYFSKSTCSFYDSELTPESQMPSDKVEVSQERYDELMALQTQGYVISAGSDGAPIASAQACSPCDCLVHDRVVATAEKLGHIKPDGTSLVVAEDGTASVGSDFDGAVVHKSGAETITGTKTLSGNGVEILFDNPNATKKNLKGYIARTTSGFCIGVREGMTDLDTITFSENGTFGHRPTDTADQGDYQLATVGWVNSPNGSQNVVHRTGEETITGTKTLSDGAKLTGVPTPTADADAVNKKYVDEELAKKVNTTSLANYATSAELTAETNARASGDKTNADAIAAEATRAKAAEKTNADNIATNADAIAAEITRAKAAEKTNADNIATNADAIAAEITRAKAAENSLSTTKADDSDVVKLTGNQTVAGNKTFSKQTTFAKGEGIKIAGTNNNFTIRSTGSTAEGISVLLDNDANKTAFSASPDGTVTIGGSTFNKAKLGYTVAASSNSNEPATTKWVGNRLGGLTVVTLTQSAYDALTTKSATTLYIITE